MAVYQDKARERISKGLRKFRGVVERARATNANESNTRMIVSAVVTELFGWDPFTDLTGEYRVKSTYADFCLKHDSKCLAVIEVKPVTTGLHVKHVYQAVTYAANEGIDWVILTNGDEWHLYRVGVDELAAILVEEVFRPEVQGGQTARLIKKAVAAARKV